MTGWAPVLHAQPWLWSLVGAAAIACAALVAQDLVRRLLLRLADRLSAGGVLENEKEPLGVVVRRLSAAAPALVVARGAPLVPHVAPAILSVARNVAAAWLVLSLALAASAALDLANDLYQRRPEARSRPIKGYLQLLKIVLWIGGFVLGAAALMERSPVLLLSGLGAMAAVLMLVFKDTILALVASVQLTSNNMVQVGDWIEMPQLNVDGEVIDIALHTVKVQNWDKTIATVPTHRLISDTFKNWRGMQESGGRRIVRALHIDQGSVTFVSEAQQARLRRFALLEDHFERKRREIEASNLKLQAAAKEPVNRRRMTNIGIFRAYVEAYLRADPRINAKMTLIVRQMPSTAQGLPLEIYCFTATTEWALYESIQADIFDHLIAILPEFDLRIFQTPSGADLQPLFGARDAA
jgi:miniconductance mechanosensitive channel